MFSKISNLMTSTSTSSGGGQGGSSGYQRRQNASADAATATPSSSDAAGDILLLSIDALKAMVREEAALQPQAEVLLRRLGQLEQHGLQSLPLSPGQDAAGAINAAFQFLKS